MTEFINPFRPGAGHPPPYLAGRDKEKEQFIKLLRQETILENMILTGLRGVGKTVLLESLKPLAVEHDGWVWVGSDLDNTASLDEENFVTRLCVDLALATSSATLTVPRSAIGFMAGEDFEEKTLDYAMLKSLYASTPGLPLDKLKRVLEVAWLAISHSRSVRGIIFAYDEAQNLANQPRKEQFPLSLLLDAFQSLQRKGYPLMLVLTGLPALFPKLVEERTFAERMFRVAHLESLSDRESREAITKPISDGRCPIKLSEQSISTIVELSGGYPYFIQFICKEVYDAFIQLLNKNEVVLVPIEEIQHKLDTDFFAGRWKQATSRQQDLMRIAAHLPLRNGEFTLQEIVKASSKHGKPFTNNHAYQVLAALTERGLVFRNRHGRYSFAVPLFDKYIKRLDQSDDN